MTLCFVSKSPVSTTYHSQGIDDRNLRTDFGERLFTSLAQGLESAANNVRSAGQSQTKVNYDAQTRELRKKLREGAFFDPAGNSVGVCFKNGNSADLKDSLRRIAVICQGGSAQVPLYNLPESSVVRLTSEERVVWQHKPSTSVGFFRRLINSPGTLYLTNLRLIEECATARGIRLREVFPNNSRD